MTVIKTLPSSLSVGGKITTSSHENSTRKGNLAFDTATKMKMSPPLLPSDTEEEAKRRFNLALSKGVKSLLDKGHGRDRASTELLNEISNGCSPDEEEIFQTMKSLGLSLDDATKVITVSTAFRSAAGQIRGNTNQGNPNIAIEAIDDLTSRLKLANLLRGGGGASSPIPASPFPQPPVTTLSTTKSIGPTIGNKMQAMEVAIDASLHRPTTSAITANTGQQTATTKDHHNSNQGNNLQQGGGGRGRKRALADKTPEVKDSNIIITEKQPSTAVKAIDPLEAKEKILNAKLSKVEGSGSSSGAARSKSPDGGGGIGGARGMRGAATVQVHHVEDSLTNKRPRTRSQTEESISEI